MHLRMTGTVLYDPPPDDAVHPRALRARRRRHVAELLRPAPLRHRRARARLRRRSRRSSTRASASSRSARTSPPSTCTCRRASGARRSRRCCSTSGASPASATSTPTRRSFAPASTRCAAPALLKRAQVAALRDAVVASLEAGLGAGGASIDDFRHPDGVKGAFQNEFLVHSREGEPCTVCGTPVRKFVAAGRGTYACESCQTRPRARRAALSASRSDAARARAWRGCCSLRADSRHAGRVWRSLLGAWRVVVRYERFRVSLSVSGRVGARTTRAQRLVLAWAHRAPRSLPTPRSRRLAFKQHGVVTLDAAARRRPRRRRDQPARAQRTPAPAAPRRVRRRPHADLARRPLAGRRARPRRGRRPQPRERRRAVGHPAQQLRATCT